MNFAQKILSGNLFRSRTRTQSRSPRNNEVSLGRDLSRHPSFSALIPLVVSGFLPSVEMTGERHSEHHFVIPNITLSSRTPRCHSERM